MPVEGWFATPIYYNYIENVDSVQQELESAFKKLEFDKKQEWGENTHSVSDITFDSNVIESMNLKFFETEIKKNVDQFLRDLNSQYQKPYKISSCWFTKTKPHEHTRIHNHGYTDISGVYYFKTNNNDGDIVFLSPSPVASMVFAKLQDTVSYRPEIGKMILFPGSLYHTVNENETEEERISVSFNVYFER